MGEKLACTVAALKAVTVTERERLALFVRVRLDMRRQAKD